MLWEEGGVHINGGGNAPGEALCDVKYFHSVLALTWLRLGSVSRERGRLVLPRAVSAQYDTRYVYLPRCASAQGR